MIRFMQFFKSFDKNLGKTLIESAKNMFDLARSCQELLEKVNNCEKKIDNNPLQVRLDQRNYYVATVHTAGRAIMSRNSLFRGLL